MHSSQTFEIWQAVQAAGENGLTSEGLVDVMTAKGIDITKGRAGGMLSRLWNRGCLARKKDESFKAALRYVYTAPEGVTVPPNPKIDALSACLEADIARMKERSGDAISVSDDDDSLEGFARRLEDSFGFFDPNKHVGFGAMNAFLGIRKAVA